MNYSETMTYIKEKAKFGSNYGLKRTDKILELLGNPHKKIKCIHIAGTNGKGSTTAMISKILQVAGYKVGMYTSPYLEEFEERIQIDGRNIPKEDLSRIVTEVAGAVDKVIELGYDNPTEFEIITCAMFLYFHYEAVDFAVIEVGLGGRLDSTNVIEPILSIITSISYDHMKILGNTLSEIVEEKAGIIKNNVPLVLYPQEEGVLQVIEKRCAQRNSKLVKVPKDSADLVEVIKERKVDMTAIFQRIIVRTEAESYEIDFSLLGIHQILNAATVVFAIEELIKQGIKVSKEHILKALHEVTWKGRLEILKSEPMIVIDGAHNIDGIEKLSESIDLYFEYKNMILILGILADKQVDEMAEKIVSKAKKVITVTPHSDRAASGDELLTVVRKFNKDAVSVEDYEEAFKEGIALCDKEDLLMICGSLYMIGDMRKIIKGYKY